MYNIIIEFMDSNSPMQSSNAKKYITIILTVLVLALLLFFIGYNIKRSNVPATTTTANNPLATTPEEKIAQLSTLGASGSVNNTTDAQKSADLGKLGSTDTGSGTTNNQTPKEKMGSLNSL